MVKLLKIYWSYNLSYNEIFSNANFTENLFFWSQILLSIPENILNYEQYQNYFSKCNWNTSYCWLILNITWKCYLYIFFLLIVVKVTKNYELEINKKKSSEAQENKSRKGNIDIWRTQCTKHERQLKHEGISRTRHMTYEALTYKSTWGAKVCKARPRVRVYSRKSMRHMRHEST